MALTGGARLGPYEIVALLGAGGMGEVYRARDTKLGRDVAIKVLPESLSNDPERLARFSREAQLLAALNHSNIAHIHGFEDSTGVAALVMELVDGPTLADRIARGPIPLDEALPIAKQIADALEGAHEQGIIHRDLKPANIKVRDDGTVKVLDFGLAKAVEPKLPSINTTQPPTITTPAMMTGVGVVLGTAAYMSPEQARGKPADKRSDIWAFGCVLFEMLTGKRPFDGEDVSETLANVLKTEPDWTRISGQVPAPIERLVRRSLEKDRARRLDSAVVARLELEAAQEQTASPIPQSVSRTRARMGWRLASAIAAAALVASAVIVRVGRSMTPALTPIRFSIQMAPGHELFIGGGARPALSPDGRVLVYPVTSRDGVRRLYRRALDQLDAVPIPGTENTTAPFFSPDGQWLGFTSLGQLRKVYLAGGAAATVGDCRGCLGAVWQPDGAIVTGNNRSPALLRVPAAGGIPQPLPSASGSDRLNPYYPSSLPSGKAVVLTLWSGSLESARIAVRSLESDKEQILFDGTGGQYVPTGHIVFASGSSLWAVPFDAGRLEMTGAAVPVVEDVQTNTGGLALFATSPNGTLAYVPGASGTRRTLAWVDAEGREQSVTAEGRPYYIPRISPDGTRIAVSVQDAQYDVWIFDIARSTFERLTLDSGRDSDVVWTPDGKRIAYFSSPVNAESGVFWRAADGTGHAERLTTGNHRPLSWSPDGRQLVTLDLASGGDLMLVSVDEGHAIKPLLATPARENLAEVSPNGRWLAYETDETGRNEIFVRPFPDVASARARISQSGGQEPAWSRDGRTLYFRSGAEIMSVDVGAGSPASWGVPRRVFQAPYFVGNSGARQYDVGPDGRFLMIKEGDRASNQIVVVLNWFTELQQRVPTK